ncbi:MAG: monofunctional biosynthetic peptidoglycan transglycosylase [Oceanospirillales bacterium]|nr:MAG: monofunctional biosynthetic peptidoglycan transglycosylase [Oceanospirillales bacterium]
MIKTLKRWIRRLFLTLLLICVLFLLLVWSLRWINPPTTSFMLQHNVRALFNEDLEFARHHWVPLAEIPAAIQLAVIASEDQKFPDHRGIDWAATQAAIDAYRSGRAAGGGSTITQQVVKNLFLWGDRSTFRKVIEWGLAVLVEVFWSKERILEIYLNIAQFGRQEYGVGAASQYLFNKPVSQITREEAAMLAVVLPSPARMDVTRPSQYMRSRQAFILRQMRNLGGEAYLQRLSGMPLRPISLRHEVS